MPRGSVPDKDFHKACCGGNIRLLKKWHTEQKFPVNAIEIIKKKWTEISQCQHDTYAFLLSIYSFLPVLKWYILIETDIYNDLIIQLLEKKCVVLTKINTFDIIDELYDMFESCRRASYNNLKTIIKFIGYENRTELLFVANNWFGERQYGRLDRVIICTHINQIFDIAIKEGVDINRLFDGRSLYELGDSDKSDMLIQNGIEINEKRMLDQTIYIILENIGFGLLAANWEVSINPDRMDKDYLEIRINAGNKQKFFIGFDFEFDDEYFDYPEADFDPDYKSEIEIFIDKHIGCKTYKGPIDEIENIVVKQEGMTQNDFEEFKNDYNFINANSDYCIISIFEYQFEKCNEESSYAGKDSGLICIGDKMYYDGVRMLQERNVYDAIEKCEKYGG
jgi:hypothetical protein